MSTCRPPLLAQATSKVPMQKASKRKSPPKFHFPSQQLHTKYLEDTVDKNRLPLYKAGPVSIMEQSGNMVQSFRNEMQRGHSTDATNDASKSLSNSPVTQASYYHFDIIFKLRIIIYLLTATSK